MNAVIDTNIWVSGLLSRSGTPSRVLEVYRLRQFELVISESMLDELAEVLRRPKITRKYRVTEADITELQTLIHENARFVPIFNTVHVCRDPDDDVVIETAIEGRADVIVSGDADLWEAADVRMYLCDHQIRVISAGEFLQKISSQ